MLRVIIALVGVACGFAALVVFLELERTRGGTLWAAAAVFIGVLAVGFPVLYQCCKRRWWEAWRFILLGTLGGGLCSLLFGGGAISFGFLLMVFVLTGTTLGALFWFAALWRNDNLTCPKSFCLPCGMVYKVAHNALRRRDL